MSFVANKQARESIVLGKLNPATMGTRISVGGGRAVHPHHSKALPSPNGRQRLISQILHQCSNPDTCDIDTRLCQNNNFVGMTEMSTDMKLENNQVLNELAELNKVNLRERLGGKVSHDF